MEFLFTAALLLACPIGMGLFMLVFMRSATGRDQAANPAGDASDGSRRLEDLTARRSELEQELEELRSREVATR